MDRRSARPRGSDPPRPRAWLITRSSILVKDAVRGPGRQSSVSSLRPAPCKVRSRGEPWVTRSLVQIQSHPRRKGTFLAKVVTFRACPPSKPWRGSRPRTVRRPLEGIVSPLLRAPPMPCPCALEPTLARFGPRHRVESVPRWSARRSHRPKQLLRCVGPQHARDLSLRAEVDCTEASKSATSSLPDIREGVGYSGMQRGV
jgi:hypothetical protein